MQPQLSHFIEQLVAIKLQNFDGNEKLDCVIFQEREVFIVNVTLNHFRIP